MEATTQKTILIAEDVESNFLLLRAYLKNNYNLLHACNGIEAIEMFKQYHPDLILMDVKMPEMDGIKATQQIRKLSITVPIIAQTAFAFDQDRVRIIEAGCDDYLTKPISPASLKETIEKYI